MNLKALAFAAIAVTLAGSYACEEKGPPTASPHTPTNAAPGPKSRPSGILVDKVKGRQAVLAYLRTHIESEGEPCAADRFQIVNEAPNPDHIIPVTVETAPLLRIASALNDEEGLILKWCLPEGLSKSAGLEWRMIRVWKRGDFQLEVTDRKEP